MVLRSRAISVSQPPTETALAVLPSAGAVPARSRSASPRPLLALGLSLGLHGVLLALAIVLCMPAARPAEEKRALVSAMVEVVEPLDDSAALEEGLTYEPLPCSEDLEILAPTLPSEQPLVEEARLEAPASVSPNVAPLDVPDIPLEALRLRVWRPEPPVAEPPPAVPAPRVAAPTPPAPVAPRGAPLRLLRKPDVRRYYSLEARRRGLEGTAVVRIHVNARGFVIAARIARSSGHALLDAHAIRFARDLRFAAGAGGAARLPVEFILDPVPAR